MTTQKVVVENGVIHTPDNPTLLYIEGDGIGKDIWQTAEQVFAAAVQKAYGDSRSVTWKEVLAGEKAFNLTGEWLPSDTVETIREYLVALKGPLGTPTGGGHRSLNVTMRQELDLYVCLRPVRYFEGTPSPVKHPERVDMTIFRENTEDVYAGIEFEAGSRDAKALTFFLTEVLKTPNKQLTSDTNHLAGLGVKFATRDGSQRLVKAAIDYALKNGKKTVTIVHKGNIQKFTEGAFLKWGHEYAETHYADKIANGELFVNDVIADNFLQQVLLRPEQFDVVALTNLNGDYASDAVAAQVGGIGIAPGGNINYKTGHAIFEATHGTAPDIAGKNLANPCSILLSGAMMFEYLGWNEVAVFITAAIEQTIANKTVTGDFARLMDDATQVGTVEFGELLITAINNM